MGNHLEKHRKHFSCVTSSWYRAAGHHEGFSRRLPHGKEERETSASLTAADVLQPLLLKTSQSSPTPILAAVSPPPPEASVVATPYSQSSGCHSTLPCTGPELLVLCALPTVLQLCLWDTCCCSAPCSQNPRSRFHCQHWGQAALL